MGISAQKVKAKAESEHEERARTELCEEIKSRQIGEKFWSVASEVLLKPGVGAALQQHYRDKKNLESWS